MAIVYSGDNITFSDGSTIGNGWAGFKNRIINGAMTIDQRNAGASVTANNDIFGTDRFKISTGYTSKATIQQSTTVPSGFKNSILITSSAATSTSAGDYMTVVQAVEGLNVTDLGWGAAGAATVTLSFWVRSSLTGTFGGSINNSGNSRSYVFSYTINAANTWEQKTITIPGDTTGTWLTTNGVGLIVRFSIAMGSTYTNSAGSWYSGDYEGVTGQTNILNTNGATFYITGVQLEKGSAATSFEYRPYSTELALCQRYFQIYAPVGADDTVAMGNAENTSRGYFAISLPVSMRTAPTCTLTASRFQMRGTTSFVVCTSGTMGGNGGMTNTRIAGEFNSATAHNAPAGGCVKLTANSNATILISAEL